MHGIRICIIFHVKYKEPRKLRGPKIQWHYPDVGHRLMHSNVILAVDQPSSHFATYHSWGRTTLIDTVIRTTDLRDHCPVYVYIYIYIYIAKQ
jgi:hypothetical protein